MVKTIFPLTNMTNVGGLPIIYGEWASYKNTIRQGNYRAFCKGKE
jgi:hypothetical protein